MKGPLCGSEGDLPVMALPSSFIEDLMCCRVNPVIGYMDMQDKWIDREKAREANRERELEKKRVVFVKSDLYPDGEFLPELEARISIFDRGFTVGDSVYEYARTYRHRPFQVREHMDRLFMSLKVLRIDPGFCKGDFCRLCEELTGKICPYWRAMRNTTSFGKSRGGNGVGTAEGFRLRRGWENPQLLLRIT